MPEKLPLLLDAPRRRFLEVCLELDVSEDLLEKKVYPVFKQHPNFGKVRDATFPSFTPPTWHMGDHDEQQYRDIFEEAIGHYRMLVFGGQYEEPATQTGPDGLQTYRLNEKGAQQMRKRQSDGMIGDARRAAEDSGWLLPQRRRGTDEEIREQYRWAVMRFCLEMSWPGIVSEVKAKTGKALEEEAVRKMATDILRELGLHRKAEKK
jgi:hypothetical protein